MLDNTFKFEVLVAFTDLKVGQKVRLVAKYEQSSTLSLEDGYIKDAWGPLS